MHIFSPEDITRICRLNACLLEAANWIADRAGRTQAAFIAGGGAEGWQDRDDGWEDYELEAVVKCSLGDNDPAFNPDDEYGNMIAVVETPGPTREGCLAWSDCSDAWDAGLPYIDVDGFRQTQFCFLFHEIYEHTLHFDRDSLLRIGEIEVNLVLWRQRGFRLDKALLPRKRKTSYPRSVFGRKPCPPVRTPLTYRERRYARALNETLAELRAWIEKQARYGEEEYAALGGLAGGFAADGAYEDYAMMARVTGNLEVNHPECDEDDDNIVVTHNEPLYTKMQRVCGRARNPMHHSRYGAFFSHNQGWGTDELKRIQPCGLFWDIFKGVDRDWLTMLSIGRFDCDVFCVQRRIAQV